MADARIGVVTPFVAKDEDGTASSWKDLYRSYRIILIRNYFRLRNSIQNGMWPTSSNYLIIACVLCIYLMEFKPAQVQVLSNILCELSLAVPLPNGSPTWFRNVVFSFGISVLFFLAVMKLRQYILRMLLSYKGWMYEMAKTQSIITLIWAFLVRFVSGYRPSLYSFQNSLPRMNVPPLSETLEKLLESLEPLSTADEMKEYRHGVDDFKNTIGNKLQRLLHLKSWISPNYVSDWWEKYVYLRSRVPLAINSNFYIYDHYSWVPTKKQSSRAANMLYSMLSMKRQIDREELAPLVIRGTIPVCMNQYEKLFSTIRMPGGDMDELLHFESNKSRHIVVWCKDFYFWMPVVDEANKPLCPASLESLFEDIRKQASELAESGENEGNRKIAALTALPRSDWAQLHGKFFRSGQNAASLELIKTAVCMVVLYDEVPTDISHKGKILLHGTGCSLWFDKCFTLCVFPDGQSGMNCEHSMADGPVVAHVWEYALTVEVLEKRYFDNGQVMLPPKTFKQKAFKRPYKISWDITDELIPHINRAFDFAVKCNNDLDLVLFNHTNFGKGFIKTAKISPDAFIQIALQLSYYRDAGRFCQTYESSATRLFLQGRTETIRSCTKESCEFVRAMEEGKKGKSELIELLQRAAKKHRLLYLDAMSGRGVDRHLFALYVASRGIGYSNKFLEDVLSRPWTLSTSQQPQQQMEMSMPDINSKMFREMVGPGGGFGPVADDGYGVSYMIPTEYNIFFHVTSKRSSAKTSSQAFVNHIENSMADMRNLFLD